MTRLSLLTDRRFWRTHMIALSQARSSLVVSKFLCQSNDRRGDEVDYHGFVSKIDLRQSMLICAVDLYFPERDHCKSDQHCWPGRAQRHALATDFQDIMTTRILFHLDLDSKVKIVRLLCCQDHPRDNNEPDALPASNLWQRKSLTMLIRFKCHSRTRREVNMCR